MQSPTRTTRARSRQFTRVKNEETDSSLAESEKFGRLDQCRTLKRRRRRFEDDDPLAVTFADAVCTLAFLACASLCTCVFAFS
mmetsp:Transcript_41680/g.110308  ORF Transcript_41680/g.110308 Transcript_41680/m.110308 type:complete len:83 (+) Transcript_41680:77-325(+)